jgi:hypothetical protein
MSFKTVIPSFAALIVAAGCAAEPSPRPDSSDSAISAGELDCEGVPTPMCSADTVPADTTGDGCVDGCRPASCPLAILCDTGTEPADYDGDGCDDACKPIGCPPYAPTCDPGTVPADTTGDGCVDGCRAESCSLAILCDTGTEPVDTTGDGCEDACEPIAGQP